ncbi:hypothetical protein [Streptomyces spirodelae]|uniref:Type III effector protein n=1 Tax=Streptomyces spirodelae TaxID=2812904 RepID=A0ABS3WPJ9_9ACTN|nr:hypothetical protein [Streptomyces spirodelae]MBO8185041.1 hypothetical protein [Streptomyces spirodelae]
MTPTPVPAPRSAAATSASPAAPAAQLRAHAAALAAHAERLGAGAAADWTGPDAAALQQQVEQLARRCAVAAQALSHSATLLDTR